MNQNIRIAKELIKIARVLVGTQARGGGVYSEENEKWLLDHGFKYDESLEALAIYNENIGIVCAPKNDKVICVCWLPNCDAVESCEFYANSAKEAVIGGIRKYSAHLSLNEEKFQRALTWINNGINAIKDIK